MTHTKKTWSKDGVYNIVGPDGHLVAVAVKRLSIEKNDNAERVEETQANAELIRSAPELLEENERLKKEISKLRTGDPVNEGMGL